MISNETCSTTQGWGNRWYQNGTGLLAMLKKMPTDHLAQVIYHQGPPSRSDACVAEPREVTNAQSLNTPSWRVVGPVLSMRVGAMCFGVFVATR